MHQERVIEILRAVIPLAREYYKLTGKPLGITGEAGELLASQHLNLDLCPPRTPGYDAVSKHGRRYQVKTRLVHSGSMRGRVPRIEVNSPFDAVLLVLLDDDYQVTTIYEASRDAVIDALEKPGSKARNERGSLGIRQFISIAGKIWPKNGSG